MSIGGTNRPPGRSSNGAAKRNAASKMSSGSVGARHNLNVKTPVVLRTTIPSDNAASHQIQQLILEAVNKIGFTPHSSFAIKLALEEAMINAIKHGNKQDKSKNVHVEAKVTPKVAEIIIEDEGPGFDRSSVPDPTLEENLEKCSGRGILLIESYMNLVEWSHHGRRLRMIKRNGEEPGVR